jgi:formylglycine-generating enzyme required for sulfatase activity
VPDLAVISAVVGVIGVLWVIVFGSRSASELVKNLPRGNRGSEPDEKLAEDPNADAVRLRYLDRLRNQLRTVDYRALGPHYRHRLTVRLDKVYVPLTSPVGDASELTASPLTGFYVRRDEARRPLTSLLSDNDRLVVLGRAGAGKTTLLRYIALTVADALLEGDVEQARRSLGVTWTELPIPVYVSLANYGRLVDAAVDGRSRLPSLAEGVLEQLANLSLDAAEAEVVHRFLITRSCLLLCDGLDEVGSVTTRALVADAINEFAASYPSHGIVVSARPQTYTGSTMLDPSFAGWEVSELSYEDIEQFVERWHAEIAAVSEQDPADMRLEARDLLTAIERMPDVRSLATNPLLLTAIALVHHTRGVLPNRRSVLFELCTRALLGEWDLAKAPGAKLRAWDPSGGDATPEMRRTQLEYVAHYLVDHRLSDAPVQRLATLLTAQSPRFRPMPSADPDIAFEEASTFLLGLALRGGVLEEQREGRLGFTHPAFLAYLAGRRLARMPDWRDRLSPARDDEPWCQMWYLAVGHLSQRDPELATEFVRALAASEGGSTGTLRAAEALLDADQTALQRTLVLDVTAAALDVMVGGDADIQTRVACGRAVGWLGDPRDLHETVAVPAGRYLLGSEVSLHESPVHEVALDAFSVCRFPVCNDWYGEFMRSDGYRDRDLWSDEGWAWLETTKVNQPFYWNDPRFRVPNVPVSGVSWYEASAFARWAHARLPTESEWEVAARGPDLRSYPWGELGSELWANVADLHLGMPSPVGLFPANVSPFHVADAAGNVWEWTSTIYRDYPYQRNDGREDPDAPGSRVLRGGSWYGTLGEARCAARRWLHPGARQFNFGFRIAQ